MDIILLVKDLIGKIVIISWLLFLLTWIIGWAIRGSPIPSNKIRKTGQSLIEDAIWGAFWVAIGTSIFWLISYISTALGNTLPQPPLPQLP